MRASTSNALVLPQSSQTQRSERLNNAESLEQFGHVAVTHTESRRLQMHTVPYHARLTWVVGFSLQHLQLSALGERVLQAQLQESGLGPAHPLQQGQQGHRLLALVPALEPAG